MSGSQDASHEQLARQHAVRPIVWPRALFIWPPLDVRKWRCAGLISLVLLQLFLAASTSLEGPVDGKIRDGLRMATLGASMAPTTLLALWTVFGPQPIALRLPLTLWLAAANYLALLYGDWRANGADDSRFLIFGAWLVAYVLAQVPLWLIRAIGGWRLEAIPVAHGAVSPILPQDWPTARAASQFSVRGLLGWTFASAPLLAVLRTLAPIAPPDVEDLLEYFRSIVPVILITGLPIVAFAWIMLAGRLVLRLIISVLSLAAIPGGILLLVYIGETGTESEIACVAAGAILNGVACLAVIAACGYQLRRRPSSVGRKMLQRGKSGEMRPLSRRRLSLGVLGLLAVAAAVAFAAPQQLEQWRRQDATVKWRQGGFDIYFHQDGTGFNAYHVSGAPVFDEALDQIARLNRQNFLELFGSRIGDRQLALLAPMSGLRELALVNCEVTDEGFSQLPPLDALSKIDLSGAPLTDAGLAHLVALSNLQELVVAGTEITDNGLHRLAGMPKLSRLDVCRTAVTKGGVERFLAERPEVVVWYGACDQDLGRWLMICGHPNELYQGMPPCRRNPTVPVRRLHLRGTKPAPGSCEPFRVTDAALTALADLHELEELDLRDTSITDRGLQSLVKLVALKRLDLRGTAVSGRSAADLSRLLPRCQILGP